MNSGLRFAELTKSSITLKKTLIQVFSEILGSCQIFQHKDHKIRCIHIGIQLFCFVRRQHQVLTVFKN